MGVSKKQLAIQDARRRAREAMAKISIKKKGSAPPPGASAPSVPFDLDQFHDCVPFDRPDEDMNQYPRSGRKEAVEAAQRRARMAMGVSEEDLLLLDSMSVSSEIQQPNVVSDDEASFQECVVLPSLNAMDYEGEEEFYEVEEVHYQWQPVPVLVPPPTPDATENHTRVPVGPVATQEIYSVSVRSPRPKTTRSTPTTSRSRNPTKNTSGAARATPAPLDPCAPTLSKHNNNTIGLPFMDTQIQTIIVGDEPISSHTFLAKWAPHPIVKLQFKLDTKNLEQPKSSFSLDGAKYCLVAGKTHKQGARNPRFQWAQKPITDLYYVRTEAPERPLFDIQAELEKVADFRSLAPHKVSSRLELFLTPGRSGLVWDFPSVDDRFELLELEDCHLGCGFIPEQFLAELFPRKRSLDSIVSLQVRVFAPRLGIAKGMLMKKRGIDKIQLPPSMMKVGPSRTNKGETWGVMVAKDTFPSSSNCYLGRHLDPLEKDPPKSYKERPGNPLSTMYQRLLIGLGLPKNLVSQYAKISKTLTSLRHAHVKGVRDPTGQLPENTVFITGYGADDTGTRVHLSDLIQNIFVSRSPCLEPTDCKMLEIVKGRPEGMTEDSWQWLRNMKFGHIIFSVPRNRYEAVPLPMTIGDGDLDGDDYFVCFDKVILRELDTIFRGVQMQKALAQQLEQVRNSRPNDDTGPSLNNGPPSWFQPAISNMLDISNRGMVNKLTGKLYNASVEQAENSSLGIWDPDACAFANAYKASLEVLKHNTPVTLPAHLREKTDRSLHEAIRWEDSF
eukprot:Nitzschia sp. Nitz4//scaffold316_size20630//3027//5458//NITZ4_008655-RA/size20630-snap-gene-0.1-mRNA-1//1//CDS//3329547511//8970//frame0